MGIFHTLGCLPGTVWRGVHLGGSVLWVVLPPIATVSVQVEQLRCFVGGGNLYQCLCLFESTYDIPVFPMVSDYPVPDRYLGNFLWDAVSWFRSFERRFRSSEGVRDLVSSGLRVRCLWDSVWHQAVSYLAVIRLQQRARYQNRRTMTVVTLSRTNNTTKYVYGNSCRSEREVNHDSETEQ
jgi:hypothetical protein